MGVKLNFKRSQIVKMMLRCLFLFALVFGSFLADPAWAKSLLDQGKDGQEYSVNNPCMEYRCSRIFSPVCGSDGVTHGNMCLFEMTQCFMRQEGSELTIAHEGPCQEEHAIKDPCMKVCPRILAPVCDSEGKTHSNLCEFEVYQCVAYESSGRKVTLDHEGVCTKEYGVAEVLNKCLFEIRQCVAFESSGRKVSLDHDGVCLD